MKNRELLPLLEEIKQHNMAHFGEVYGVFEGLLAWFRFRLSDDDAAQELTLFFLELICSLESEKFLPDESDALKRYIAVALRNRYILLSRQKSLYRRMSNELYEGLAVDMPTEEQIELKQALGRLPHKERLVVTWYYFYGYTTEEIADRLHITRQGVNQIKKRGLAILKRYYRMPL